MARRSGQRAARRARCKGKYCGATLGPSTTLQSAEPAAPWGVLTWLGLGVRVRARVRVGVRVGVIVGVRVGVRVRSQAPVGSEVGEEKGEAVE